MYFKTKILIVLLSNFLLVSCHLKINEQPPEQKPFDFQGAETPQCLKDVLPTMSGFMKGTASAESVGNTWSCFSKALNVYGTLVRGQNNDRYSAREVARFFEEGYLNNLKISDRLLLEVMQIKKMLVGGNDQYISRTELFQLIEVSEQLRVISLRILPYMKVYSFNWQLTQSLNLNKDIRYFENANIEIQEAAKSIAAIVEANNQNYKIDNFVVLLEEIANLYKEDWQIIASLKNVMPLVFKLKKSLAGGAEDTIASHEWRRFSLLGTRGFIQYLRYYYFIKTNEELGAGAELVYLAKSFDDLFSYLGDMVAGKPNGQLTRFEIVEIFQALTQFFPDVKVSDALVFEVMKFKKLLFGGELDSFNSSDFKNAQVKVDSFRTIIEKLMSYLNIYTLSWQPQYINYGDSQRIFKRADSNLVTVAKDLSKIIEGPYDLQDFLKFIEEFEKLYPLEKESGNTSFLKTIKEYYPLFVSLHALFFSTDQTVVSKSQWPELLTLVAQIYNRGAYYYYFLSPEYIKPTQGVGLQSLNQFVVDTRSLVDFVINKKQAKVITFSEIDRIIVDLINAKVLPSTIKQEAYSDVAKLILRKILITPEDRLNAKIPRGLTLKATKNFMDEFLLWVQMQIHFDRLYKKLPPGNTLLSGQQILESLYPSTKKVPFYENYVIYDSPLSRAFDSGGRLVISPRETMYSKASTDILGFVRVIIRLAQRAYSQDLKRIYNYQGLSLVEAQQIYKDVKPILVSLDLVDPSNETFADSRFRETSLFLARSNGDDLAHFAELADLSIHIYSGLNLNSSIFKTIVGDDQNKYCQKFKVGSYEKIRVSCLIDGYHLNMAKIFNSIPEFNRYILSLPRCAVNIQGDELALMSNLNSCGPSFDGMLYNIVKSAGYIPNENGLIDLSVASYVPHVMQYIESLVQKYDQNKNGILEKEEALRSYPVFKSILIKVSGYEDDKTLTALLAWIMQYGKPPQTNLEKGKFYYIYRNSPDSWSINTDREKLASILGFIADAINGRMKLNLSEITPVKFDFNLPAGPN
jgi:hypothetical protein